MLFAFDFQVIFYWVAILSNKPGPSCVCQSILRYGLACENVKFDFEKQLLRLKGFRLAGLPLPAQGTRPAGCINTSLSGCACMGGCRACSLTEALTGATCRNRNAGGTDATGTAEAAAHGIIGGCCGGNGEKARMLHPSL